MSVPMRIAAAAAAAIALGVAGCQAGYVLEQGWGQARVVLGREPLDRVLARTDLDARVRGRLELARDARLFALAALGLQGGDNYTTYYDVGGPAVSYTLTAAPKDRLEALTWWFPIVGRVPYLGFFDKADGLARRDALVAEGYDTELRGVPAFSTLGWFSDPIFSSMLAMSETSLVNTIIHELTHATLFVPGDVEFNENLATFVGNQGAVAFFRERDGPDSGRARRVEDDRADSQRFGRFMHEMIEGLRAYYGAPVPREEKVAGREAEFARWQERFRAEVVPELRGDRYRGFADLPLNNAVVLSLGAYYRDLGLLDRALAACGGDLARLLRVFVARADRGAGMAAEIARALDDGSLCADPS